MTGTLLTLPEDPRYSELVDAWPAFEQGALGPWPRSAWLRVFEDLLREHYSTASSDDLTLTARHYAPFPLAAGHDVP